MAINEFKIEDLFEITNGSTPKTDDNTLWRDEINWYTPIDLRKGSHTDRRISRGTTKIVPEGTILLSSRAPIGYVGVSNRESWHSQGIKGFVNKRNDIILNKYFYYWLIKNVEMIKSLGVGSTFLEVSKKTLSRIIIELPDIEEQKKIIDIIEPLEEQENLLESYISIVEESLSIIYNRCMEKNKNPEIEFNKFAKESKNKGITNNCHPVGVGYDGFTNKRGKIATTSKYINYGEIGIGLISKDIPIGLNLENKKLGISTAYYVISNEESISESWFVYEYIKRNWKQYVKQTSRQGQGFEIERLLSNKIDKKTYDTLRKNDGLIVELLELKLLLQRESDYIFNQKEKAINYLI